jgi:hypothetical protein
MLMPKEVENEQRTVPGIPQTCNTQNTSNGRTNTTEVRYVHQLYLYCMNAV